ncbi:C40 family peptidase [Kutzneria sp. 744]|uniref:C40 family peptidase n=1 Tax=Kutzneria sp. (strain 744) TaxID=345341 RepID=UPI0004B00D1B|nr:C40 family peptidase [Kutzneria sp. 744]
MQIISTTKAAVIGGACVLLLPVVFIAAAVGGLASRPAGGSITDCAATGATTAVAGYQHDQIANATTIVAVGRQLAVPPQGWVVAIAAALQESGLHNLDYGDRDSLGLFQQRPSQGWGTPAQIMNPSYAATQFYQHLLAVPGWQQMSVTDAAQAVQRSGFPGAYAQHEQAARDIVAALTGVVCTGVADVARDCDSIQASNNAALNAVLYACRQVGKPYIWGGDGNPGFDCSGLTHAAYAAAGITLPRVAQDQYSAGPQLPTGQPLQPGDLVFFGTSTTTITHVGIVISPAEMIDAPDVGQQVRVDRIGSHAGATRPTIHTQH